MLGTELTKGGIAHERVSPDRSSLGLLAGLSRGVQEAIELAKIHRVQLLVVHVLSMLPVIPDAYMAPTVWDDLEQGQPATAQR